MDAGLDDWLWFGDTGSYGEHFLEVRVWDSPQYDVSPDGQRFLMLRVPDPAEGAELILVQNFFEELKERVPN